LYIYTSKDRVTEPYIDFSFTSSLEKMHFGHEIVCTRILEKLD